MSENYQQYFKTVEERYDIDPYPRRDPEKEREMIYVTATEYLGKINHYCYGGERDLRDNCRFLVAGGGTGDAAIYLAEQLRNTESEVVYIDISSASMKVAQSRAEVRGLTNIKWLHGSLIELPNMNLGEFDYINCSGVLHHLEDPLAALKALDKMLKSDGCMGLLLYAKYGRASLYNLQSLMQVINSGVSETQDKIDRAKIMLKSLETVPSQWLLRDKDRWSMELNAMGVQENSDTGFYHLFLHEDHSFTLPQLYQLIGDAGLCLAKLTGFPGHTRKYEPTFSVNNTEFNEMIDTLTERDRKAAGELINGSILSHTLYVSKQDGVAADLNNMDNIPYIQYKFAAPEQMFAALQGNPGKSMNVKMGSDEGDMLIVKQGRYTKYLVKHLDGSKSLGEILDCVKNDVAATGDEVDHAVLMDEYAMLCRDFDEWDMILCRNKNVPHYSRSDELGG